MKTCVLVLQLLVLQSGCGAAKQLSRLHCFRSLTWQSGGATDDDFRWLWAPRTVISVLPTLLTVTVASRTACLSTFMPGAERSKSWRRCASRDIRAITCCFFWPGGREGGREGGRGGKGASASQPCSASQPRSAFATWALRSLLGAFGFHSEGTTGRSSCQALACDLAALLCVDQPAHPPPPSAKARVHSCSKNC